jgi:hypothetical protein
MAMSLQPPPRRHMALEGEWFSRAWDQWFQALSRLLNAGQIPWSALDLTDANHEDIPTVQGGSATERYHLTSAEYTELQRGNNVTTVSVSTALDDTHRTVLVDTSGVTVTLPAASSARIGQDWTVAFTGTGYVDVAAAGSDDIVIEDTSTETIRLDEKGASLTVRCATATSWVIV